MDQKLLIDTIVAKVLRNLQGGDGANKAGSPKNIVERGTSSAARILHASPRDIASYIDHTMLRPEAQTDAFDRLCEEALTYGFYSVCVNSCRVAYVARKLQGTTVKVCSVIGFPLGAMTSRVKAFEAREAISDGASELDMVINIGFLKSGDYRVVEEDIRAVRRATRANTVLKVIIETALLTQDQKIMACEIAKKAGADFVKTCTGFAGGGATVEDIALMRRVVGKNLGVKASGSVRSYEKAVSLIGAGATRIGAVSSIAIVSDQV